MVEVWDLPWALTINHHDEYLNCGKEENEILSGSRALKCLWHFNAMASISLLVYGPLPRFPGLDRRTNDNLSCDRVSGEIRHWPLLYMSADTTIGGVISTQPVDRRFLRRGVRELGARDWYFLQDAVYGVNDT
jgi:hypothetical protein